MMEVKAVIFDLDGTLVRSKHDYAAMTRGITDVFRGLGFSEEFLGQRRKVWEITRGGVESIEKLGFNHERSLEIQLMVNKALNDAELKAIETVEPMPNVHHVLNEIRERGMGMGVATRSGRPYAEECLKVTSLSEFFPVVLARDEVEHPKPDPRHLLEVVEALKVDPENVVYVGDTTTDFTTAKAANIDFLGFPTNEEWGKRLVEAGCEHLIADLSEILEVIEGGLPLN